MSVIGSNVLETEIKGWGIAVMGSSNDAFCFHLSRISLLRYSILYHDCVALNPVIWLFNIKVLVDGMVLAVKLYGSKVLLTI